MSHCNKDPSQWSPTVLRTTWDTKHFVLDERDVGMIYSAVVVEVRQSFDVMILLVSSLK